jgi:hypothetical protein
LLSMMVAPFLHSNQPNKCSNLSASILILDIVSFVIVVVATIIFHCVFDFLGFSFLWWLMMFTIFSYACCLFKYLYSGNVFSFIHIFIRLFLLLLRCRNLHVFWILILHQIYAFQLFSSSLNVGLLFIFITFCTCETQ